MAGKIELMLGPVRSNKTAELLRRAEMRRQYAKQYVLVLKPSDDTKGGPGLVESRNPNGHAKMNALEFSSNDPWSVLKALDDLEQEIGKRVECIAIDEGQFVTDLFFLRRICSTPITTCSLRDSTSTFAPCPSGDAQPFLARERLRWQHYRVHGLLHLRRPRPLFAAAHRR